MRFPLPGNTDGHSNGRVMGPGGWRRSRRTRSHALRLLTAGLHNRWITSKSCGNELLQSPWMIARPRNSVFSDNRIDQIRGRYIEYGISRPDIFRRAAMARKGSQLRGVSSSITICPADGVEGPLSMWALQRRTEYCASRRARPAGTFRSCSRCLHSRRFDRRRQSPRRSILRT